MNLDLFPRLKETLRFRKEEVGVMYLDQITESMALLTSQEAVILSLCDGEKRVNEIVDIIKDVFHSTHKIALKNVEGTLDKCTTVIDFFSKVSKSTHKLDPCNFVYKVKSLSKSSYPEYSAPFVISLNVTPRCNFFCNYCYKGTLTNRTLSELSTGEIHNIIDECDDLGVIRTFVTGGEPFLRRDITEIISHFLEHDIFPYISTNGYFVSKKIVKELSGIGLREIQISFDCSIPEIQDFISGVKGSYDRIAQAIACLTGSGIKVRTKCVVTKHNIEKLGEYIDDCHKLGVKHVGLSPFFPGNYSDIEEDKKLLATKSQMLKAMETTNERQEKYKSSMEVEMFSPIFKFEGKPEKGICGGMITSLAILPDGTIHACDLLEGVEELAFGNIRENTIKESWFSEKAKRFRNLDSFKPAEPCCSCRTLKWCRTGCLSYSLACYQDLYAADPRCIKSPKVKGISEYLLDYIPENMIKNS